MLRDYKLVIANKDSVTFSFIIEDLFLVDTVEAALLHAEYPDVQIYDLIKSYIDERHIHTEQDLAAYDFYQTYLTHCEGTLDHSEVSQDEVLFNGN